MNCFDTHPRCICTWPSEEISLCFIEARQQQRFGPHELLWQSPPLYLYMAVRGNITLFYWGPATTEVWSTWIALTITPAVSVHGRQRKYHFVLLRPGNNRGLVHMNCFDTHPRRIGRRPSEAPLSPKSQNSRVLVNVKWFSVKWFSVKWFNVKWFKAHWGFQKQKTNMIKL